MIWQERQREVSAGLRDTYEKLVKRGMIKDTNSDGTPAKVPDMDEVGASFVSFFNKTSPGSLYVASDQLCVGFSRSSACW